MFTIKLYEPGSQDYEAFSARSYRRYFEFENIHLAMEDGAQEGLTRHRTVLGVAYVENSAGKTIDTIKAYNGKGETVPVTSDTR